jgi:hypothetical protein
MAVQKGKKFDITAVLMAVAGGSVANVVMDVAEKKVGFIQQNPVTASLVPSLIGVAGVYFMDDKYKPAFYGMLGVGGGDLVDNMNLIQGFSRMNYQIPPDTISVPTAPPVETINELAITEEILESMASEPSDMDMEDEEMDF